MATTLYVDLNTLPSFKSDSYPNLISLFEQNSQFELAYSTSHISDLLVSYDGSERTKKFVYDDLALLSKLTGNRCLYFDGTEVKIANFLPQELFEERVDQAREFDTDDFSKLLIDLVDAGTNEYAYTLNWLNSPIQSEMRAVLLNPEAQVQINKMYPGIKADSTIGDLINAGWRQFRQLMNTESYKQLRNDLQGHLNLRPNQFITQEPFEAINKLYQDLINKTGSILPNSNANQTMPDWFSDITNSYLLLDIHGFQQDSIKVNERNKDTMRNTVDDGFHAAFASLCDIYITNDKRSIHKTKAVYAKFGISTVVCTVEEFEKERDNLIPTHTNSTTTSMDENNDNFFSQCKTVIEEMKNLSTEAKVDRIVSYLEYSNGMLAKYASLFKNFTNGQQSTLEAVNEHYESLAKLQERITVIENYLDINEKHLAAHDGHLDSLGKTIELEGEFTTILEKRITMLEDRIDRFDSFQ